MNKLFITLLTITSLNAFANDSVSECTIEKMKPLIEKGIKDYIIKTMNEKRIKVSSFDISYVGLIDFDETTGYGERNLIKEHAFNVTFKTESGTEIILISGATGFIDPKPPLYAVLSTSELINETQYDNEGNITGKKCISKSHSGKNRNVYFMNTSSKKVIEVNLVSYRNSYFAIADIY